MPVIKKKNKMQRDFIALGSNLGNRELNLQTAKQLIETRLGPISASSGIYRTEPWGYQDQPEFYNQVIEIETTQSPEVALRELLHIEEEMGRKRTFKNASRIIDLDILFFSDLIIQHSDIIIPHPRISERRFVLEPLNEIAPEFVHPILQKTIHQLLMECPDTLKVEIEQPRQPSVFSHHQEPEI